jgi:hypothetical protein
MPARGGDRLPLGEVLVQHGILTPAQLAAALERQRETGRQLGEIIVGLGFATGPMIAQALATQQGGLTKTEYGFATGWSTGSAPAPVAEAAADELTELRRWATEAQAAIEARDVAIAQLQAALEAAQSNRWASAPRHVIVGRGATSYEVDERDGPPPAVGDTVDGRRVAHVAAPVPGGDVPWVYLAE